MCSLASELHSVLWCGVYLWDRCGFPSPLGPGGDALYWSPAYLDLAPENQALYPRGAAAIGSALPMALEAQLAAPRREEERCS
jgi:hypothetical protein